MNLRWLIALFSFFLVTTAHAQVCGSKGLWLQVLGSGGPELTDRRAGSAYLIWQNGHARILIDMGPGSLLRYEDSQARIEDLDVILLTHLHVDHSADLPALIKASYFSERNRDLPIYGPSGNNLMPATQTFVQALFAGPNGAYRYLSDYLDGSEAYKLVAHDVPAEGKTVLKVLDNGEFKLSAVPVHHGAVPALAWRIDIGGRSLAISGDMSGDNQTLPTLAVGVDLLVAHHAIPENTGGAARALHMPPSVIGEIAAEAKVKQLVLSHRMNRTLGRERESTALIRQRYRGPLTFAEDGQCFLIRSAKL